MLDLLPDRLPQPPLRPPLGLLPQPRRARVKGVSGAHHGEVGELPVDSPDVASSSDSRSGAATGERRWTVKKKGNNLGGCAVFARIISRAENSVDWT